MDEDKKEDWVEVEVEASTSATTDPTSSEESKEPVEKSEKSGKGAEKRIRQLLGRVHEKDAEIAQLRSQLGDLSQKVEKTTQVTTQMQDAAENATLKAIEAKIASAQREYEEAYESADKTRLVKAHADLVDAKIEHRIAAAQIQTRKQVPAKTDQPKTQQPPAAALAWTRERDWFGKGPGKNAVATMTVVGISDQLIEEGWDPASKEFYEEVDKQARKIFPDLYKEDDEPAEEKKPKNPVSGASRTPAKGKVKLSSEDVAVARKLGVPLEEYARQKAMSDPIMEAGGYIPITIPTRAGASK